MTAFVLLLFIAMVPIDSKTTNFSLHLYIYIYCPYLRNVKSSIACKKSHQGIPVMWLRNCYPVQLVEEI